MTQRTTRRKRGDKKSPRQTAAPTQREAALRWNEKKFSAICNKAPFANAVATLPDGVIVETNEGWVKLFGFSREEAVAVGKTSVELRINRNPAARTRFFTDVARLGSVRDWEANYFTKPGAARVVSTNIDEVEFGGKKHLLSTMLDINEQKQTEEHLRRREAYLAEGERIGQMGSWAVNMSSGEIFWSREMFRIYQLDPATTKLSSAEVFEIIHPEDRVFVRESFNRAVCDKSDYEVHHRAILPDGTLKYLHSLGRPVLNESGDVVEYLGMVVDVTKQTQTEALLRGANEKMEMILDSITEMFFAVDKEWRYTYFNTRAKEQLLLLGKNPEALIGKALWKQFPHPPIEKHLRRAMRERVALAVEHFYPPLGEWVENRIYPMPDGGLAMYVRYITERKRAEEALQKTQAELANVTRETTMGEMAASIAHEINQPLGAIVNNGNVCLQLVGTRGSEKKKREALLDIVNDANRASAILVRIRALTKRSTAEKTSLSLKELVADVLAVADHATIKAGVTIKTSVPASLRVPGDRIQLQQMLLNLVMNALEAMSAGDNQKRVLTISARRDELGPEPAVLIKVRDTGIGFGPEEVGRLFDAFYTTKPQGMGMGLRISRSVVETHGGRLWADPQIGTGATFYCALPVEDDSTP